ncbi:MAG: two component, sigma54 specific, transcriptional regulator, Fis family protein [Rariglobus sp.]|jgi:DNA-binding NtrC family response regulator|nr:two component, sigma54 specific, transcriptional regulator, Fis family protein [Rariglobus sp.]
MSDLVLIVDDQPANLAVLSDLLEPAGHQILSATHAADALRIARKARPHLILLDVVMPGTDGLAVCRELKADETLRDIPVIFITGRADAACRIEGFAAGGVDYIVKPFEAAEVLARVRTHLDLARTRRELAGRLDDLRAEIARREAAEAARQDADQRLSVLSAREARKWNVAGLVGRSRALTALLREVERLQGFGRTGVLLTGESGTGKELVARALHSGSPRAQGPFIPVNCVAVPGELMESMFFGHLKGAFTGATVDRKGFFELAHGGTLFLDEIGDMPAALQAKLLRVLEDGRITPLGASGEKQVDVRVIAATNAHLEEKIAAGTFRQDLYFRLARSFIRVPPLRERPEDIPLLAAHFIAHFATEMGRPAPAISAAALAALAAHPWTGNIRELRNVIESALISSGGRTVMPHDLRFIAALPSPSPAASSANPFVPPATADDALPFNLDAAERTLIRRAVAQAGGNIAEAARLLGVHRTRIYRVLAEA